MSKTILMLRALAAGAVLALVLGLVGSAPTALADQHLQTAFIIERDDFSERGVWPTGDDEGFRIEYTADGLRIRNDFFSSYVSTVRGFPANVFVEVEAERTAGPAGSYYGAVCRWQNIHNYYALVVFGDGRYAIARNLNGVVEFLDSGVASQELFDRTGPNRIGGTCDGSALTLMLNSAALLQVQDTTFTEGAAGMMTGTIGIPGLEVVFSQIIVGGPQTVAAFQPGQIPQTGAGETVYIVQPGDTFSEIAFEHNLTMAELLERNPQIQNPRLIFPGQQLIIPTPTLFTPVPAAPTPAAPTPTPASPTPTPVSPTPTVPVPTPTPASPGAQVPPVFFIPETGPSEQLYTVQPGDTLAEIAAEYNLRVDDIVERNPQIIHPNILIPGQQLAIPLTGAEPETAPSTFPPETVIYEDDFSAGQWFTQSGELFNAAYQAGTYRMTNNQESSFFSSVRSFDYTDIHVEASAVQAGGPESGYYGVVCRWQDVHNYYAFVIRGDGLSAILRIQDGQVYVLHSVLAEDPDATTINRLRGSCLGQILTLSVDGQPVVAVQDQVFDSGYVGVMVGTLPDPGVEVQFSNFALLNP
jgi:LysM repeat protein